MILSSRSLTNISDIHPDLAQVIVKAAELWTGVEWIIIEGRRSLERQKELLRQRKTTTLRSRHLTGHAIDFAVKDKNGNITWEFSAYKPIALHIIETGKKLKIPVEWGGNWSSFKDGPHIQLPWKDYP